MLDLLKIANAPIEQVTWLILNCRAMCMYSGMRLFLTWPAQPLKVERNRFKQTCLNTMEPEDSDLMYSVTSINRNFLENFSLLICRHMRANHFYYDELCKLLSLIKIIIGHCVGSVSVFAGIPRKSGILLPI